MDRDVNEVISRVIASMRENLSEEFTVDDMARVAMFSKFYFTRMFRSVTGVPPMRYMQALRLQEAKRLLVSTGMTILDVSYRVGYSSPGTFSSCFKSHVGISPSEYRLGVSTVFSRQMSRAATESALSTIAGRVRASSPRSLGSVFIGAFSEPIPRRVPVAFTVLKRPGAYSLPHVPTGSWYVIAFSASKRVESDIIPSPREEVFPLEETESDPQVHKALRGPIFVPEGAHVRCVDMFLHPQSPLDPPVVLAVPELVLSDNGK